MLSFFSMRFQQWSTLQSLASALMKRKMSTESWRGSWSSFEKIRNITITFLQRCFDSSKTSALKLRYYALWCWDLQRRGDRMRRRSRRRPLRTVSNSSSILYQPISLPWQGMDCCQTPPARWPTALETLITMWLRVHRYPLIVPQSGKFISPTCVSVHGLCWESWEVRRHLNNTMLSRCAMLGEVETAWFAQTQPWVVGYMAGGRPWDIHLRSQCLHTCINCGAGRYYYMDNCVIPHAFIYASFQKKGTSVRFSNIYVA